MRATPWFRVFKAPHGVTDARTAGDPLWGFDCPLGYAPPFGTWYGSRLEVASKTGSSYPDAEIGSIEIVRPADR